jgi:hypothetical protein
MFSIMLTSKIFSGNLLIILLKSVSGLLKLLMDALRKILLKDGISILFLKKLKLSLKSIEKKEKILF